MNALRGGITVFLLAILSGCLLPAKKTEPLVGRGGEEGRAAAPTEAGDPERSGQLTAVEEFLARTKEYQIPASPAAKVNQVTPSDASASSTKEPGFSPAGKNPSSVPENKNASLNSKSGNEIAQPQRVTNAQVSLDEPATAVRQRQAVPVISGVTLRQTEPTVQRVPGEIERVSANQPAGVVAEGAPDSLDVVLQSLAEKVERGGDMDAEWQLRLHQLALRRDIEAQQVSSHASEDTRRIMQGLFDLIVTIRGVSRGSLNNGGRVISKLDALRELFSGSTEPVVSTIALCKRVVTFGVYDEIPKEELQAGKALQAIVYCEVGQVRSELGEDGRYRSKLASRAELLTSDGQSVWQKEEGEIEDVCRKKRTDFFLAQRIVFPATLKPGDYVLKVFVEDKLSSRAAENSVPVSIFGGSAVTSRR